MSVLVKCEKVTQTYGERIILDAIDWEILEGEKVGIVGNNGCGKSTLLEIIAGELIPTKGGCFWEKHCSVAYMHQIADKSRQEHTLSGGEYTKKKLREVLYQKHQFLLLDEPTNHLDQDSMKWLIKEIQKDHATMLIVSHDRYFLDQCVDRIIEIEEGKIRSFAGNYSFYQKEKERLYQSQLHAYEVQEKRKEKIEAEIENLKGWSQKAHHEARAKAIETGNKFGGKEHNRAKAKKRDRQVASKIKRLEAMIEDGVEKPKEVQKISFSLLEPTKGNKRVIEAKKLGKAFGKHVLFKDSQFYINRGEKIGIYGPNGCGKSTLIKAIMGELAVEGELFVSQTAQIGYMSQDISDIDPILTVETYLDLTGQKTTQIAREKLIQMGFEREQFTQCVGTLSRGQQMKLKLLKMILKACPLLILDEPTNHMDLHVRETLESVLENYEGTLLLITHDRYMMERICDHLLVFKGQTIKRFEGTLKEYEERQQKPVVKKELEKQKLEMEHRLTYLLGQLCMLKAGSARYLEVEMEYEQLLAEKKALTQA